MITEFVASNDNGITDGDGNSSDWIEIHNPTSEAVELAGWHLTDDATRLDKWAFPNISIAANEYLVVFASGQSSDTYADRLRNYHTNFKLGKGGEFLGLSYADPESTLTLIQSFGDQFPPQFEDVSYGIGKAVLTTKLIDSGDSVRLLVPENDSVDATWTEPTFDDSTWASGPTGIGYENSPAEYAGLIETFIPRGTDGAYVRIPFNIQDSDSIDSLTLRMKYDDGFVAYLNGESTPIASANAPTNPTHSSVATGNHPDEQAVRFVDYDITESLGLLQDGPNVLAIHALNQGTSSDMLLVPELISTQPSNAGLSFGYFTEPTPRSANSTGATNPGPAIRDVTEDPANFSRTEPLAITATVTDVAAPIDTVTLSYRVMYDEEVSIAMHDDGTAGDEVAGDGIYTALIPANVTRTRQMLRWYVTATDTNSATSRGPAFLDSEGNGQSPEYYGTVAENTFDTELPRVWASAHS